jgi:hypothetical protein
VLLLAGIVIGLLAGIATGGSLGNVARLDFRWPWVVLAALFVREAAVITPLNRIEGIQYLYAAALAALVAWTAWHVRRVPGVWIVMIGSALNLLVVLANGARMPVAAALAPSLVARGHAGQYIVMGAETRLGWLGDWIGIPGTLGGAYSLGDMFIGVGIAIVAFLATRHRDATTTAG